MKHKYWWRITLVAAGLLFGLFGCAREQSGSDAAVTNADMATQSPPTLVGTRWEWVSTVTPVDRVQAVDPARYTITLDGDGGVTAQFDCNSGRGSYESGQGEITFGIFAATRMACPEDTQDYIFMGQLEKVASYHMNGSELFLELAYDSGTMRFRAAGDSE